MIEILATGSFNPLAMSIVTNLAPIRNQGDAFGQYLTFLGMGMMAGLALCSLLVANLSFTHLYLASALFTSLGLALLLGLGPEPGEMGEWKGLPERGMAETLRTISRDGNVMLLSVSGVSFITTQAIFLSLFSIYGVHKLGLSETTVTLLLTVRGWRTSSSVSP